MVDEEFSQVVHVRLFALARDLAGCARVSVAISDSMPVGQFLERLGKMYPALEPILPSCRLAIGNEFAGESDPVSPNADLALIPPVSGG